MIANVRQHVLYVCHDGDARVETRSAIEAGRMQDQGFRVEAIATRDGSPEGPDASEAPEAPEAPGDSGDCVPAAMFVAAQQAMRAAWSLLADVQAGRAVAPADVHAAQQQLERFINVEVS